MVISILKVIGKMVVFNCQIKSSQHSQVVVYLLGSLRQAKRRMEEERMAQLEKYREDYEVRIDW